MFVPSPSAFALFLGLIGSTAAFDLSKPLQFVKRQTTFEVTSPQFGNTFSVTDDGEGSAIPLKWTVAEDIAARPIYILLVWGNNLTALERVETVNSNDPAVICMKIAQMLTRNKATAPNNGSYTWWGSYDNALGNYDLEYDSTRRVGAHSGCNYSLELRVQSDVIEVIYSPYFTIVNSYDGGLSPGTVCPLESENTRPSNGTCKVTTLTT